MREKRINFFLGVIGIIGFIGGIYGALLLVIGCLMAILIILLARLWNKYAFVKLKIKRTVSQKKAEFGQKLFYQINIENRKLLPLLWLKFEDKINEGAEFVNQEFIHKIFARNYYQFEDIFSLNWYQKTVRKYEFYPRKRGLYQFGPFQLKYSGIFGLYNNFLAEKESLQLVVYPRLIPLSAIGLTESQLFGSQMRKGWIFQDPLNIVGVRDYQRNDNIKQINWKASARHNRLKSNIYNPAFDKELHLFLNAPERGAWWSQEEKDKLEMGISTAASIVDQGLRLGYQIGFYTNISGKKYREEGYIKIKPGKDTGQRERLMTTLALLQSFSIAKLTGILETEKRMIKNGSTIVIITAKVDKELKELLLNYNQFYQLIVIRLGRDENEPLPGIKEFVISEEEAGYENKKREIN